MNFTKAQKLAIDLRNRNVLVSAAAGSGKTATLTERIIRLLTDTQTPCEITSMLIVTFTRAAAAEL
jgi:ATP-dependent helicase/nuclease subunit A